MIADIQHPKLNTGTSILHFRSDKRKECVKKIGNKNEQRIVSKNKSASVFTGGFFSPKNNKSSDSVSFSGAPKNDIWTKIGNKPKIQGFFKGKKFRNFLKKTNDLAWMESIFVFGISTTIKPLSILAVPGAKKEDKDYAATKAFLSGIVDFSLATALIKPITDKAGEFGKKIEKDPKFITDKVKYLREKDKFKTFKTLVAYTPKLMLLPVRSALTIALIPPTLKYLFPEAAKNLKAKKDKENGVQHDNKN